MTEYSLKNILVFNYGPKVSKANISDRPFSVFMYIINGSYHYKNNDIDFFVQSGDVVYIPKGSSYTFTALEEYTSRIQVEFDVEDKEGKDVTFSKNPVLGSQISFSNLFYDLFLCYSEDKSYMILSKLYEIIHKFTSKYIDAEEADDSLYKITPAVEYIKKNLSEKIYVSELSKLCNLSEAHLRRLFLKHFNASPLQYKNSLVAEVASNFLKTNHLNVSEIAFALGFSDIYTFSRFFKKEKGMSPTKYRDMFI